VRFTETLLRGVVVVEPEPLEDERGFFARTFCSEQFADRGLCPTIAQTSISYNRRRGTLRGLHYQAAPHEECKLVRCTRGAIFDVAVDLRAESTTFGRWFSVELSADNRLSLYLPVGVAHGFQTLVDDTEVLYEISTPFHSDLARGIRWDDPSLAIRWPIAEKTISERDSKLPLLSRTPEQT
jgi:dTDP-4-dehydrorhamnose 3,5-epimerase